MYWYLTQRKGWQEGTDFLTQVPLAAFPDLGAVADFQIVRTLPQMIWRVQGLYWHYGLGAAKREYDALQRNALESLGYRVIDLDEDDVLRRLSFVVEEAIQGIDHSRGARGVYG